MRKRIQAMASLIVLGLLIGGAAGCVRPATPPAVLPTPTLPSGWQSYANRGPCPYVIDHPSGMEGVSLGTYSWTLSPSPAEANGLVPNFIYISVIPADFQNSGNEIIYNYDPFETQTLMGLQVGESRALRDDPTTAPWFTYERLPDMMLGNQAAQTYENTQPWEFPLGTKEIRYYLQANNCTYLIGGYMSTVGSGQSGAIDQELFEEIIASFRLAS